MKRIMVIPICVLLASLLAMAGLAFALDESTREFTQAEKKFETKKYAEAEPLYRQAYLKYKNMGRLAAYIQVKIGECCQYQHKTEDAVLVYRNVQTVYPASPLAGQMQEKIARAYYETKQYDKAAPEFEKLSEQATATTTSTGMVNAAAVQSSSKSDKDKKNEALGYAAYCYKRSGNTAKAVAVGMKIKTDK